MKSSGMKCEVLLVLFVLVFFPVHPGFAAKEAETGVSEAKPNSISVSAIPRTLDRRYDPVIVPGDLLPCLWGLPIDDLRLFFYDNGRYSVIPFQVDERDPEGRMVFPQGKVASRDADNGLFDYNDELVFMAKDTGGRGPEKGWVELGSGGMEILVSDPMDHSKKGWVYFVHFSENAPPLSDKDYISYTLSAEQEVIKSDVVTIRYKQGSTFYSDVIYAKEHGGSGEDLFDCIKIRIEVKALFNLVTIKRSDADFRTEVIGYKDGPVRALRYSQNFFRILFDIAEPSLYSINEFYEYHMLIPVEFRIPFNLKWVLGKFGISDFTWHFYGDFPGLIGGFAYSNKNREGYHFTGKRIGVDFGTIVDLDNLVWGFNTKEGVGTWYPNLVLPDALYDICNLFVRDDETIINPPEDVPGEIAGGLTLEMAGVHEDLWDLLSKGSYQLSMATYFAPPGMKIEEADEWRNIYNFPLFVDIDRVNGKERLQAAGKEGQARVEGPPKPGGEATKKGQAFNAILNDKRGRVFPLKNISFHYGNTGASPRTSVGGRTGADEDVCFHNVEFKKIKRIEHHLEKVDPATGIENMMFQKITHRNGKVLDMVGCKPCGYSGYLEDGKLFFLWNTQINTIEFE